MKLKEIKENKYIWMLLQIAEIIDVEVRWNYSKKRKGGIYHFLKQEKGKRVLLKKQYISIFPYHYTKIEDVIFALAHELQHKFQHLFLKYPSYYQPYPTNLGVAVRAERDCDKYGTYWAKKQNPRFRRGRYKSTNVWFYEEYMENIEQ
jgi:hypothetical protein